jgi:type 2A phosphatase activator TIP41
MPHSIFILSRLFLRVDNVLFRVHDVRIYHAFGSGEIIREVVGMEAGYDAVKAVSNASPSLFSSINMIPTSTPPCI